MAQLEQDGDLYRLLSVVDDSSAETATRDNAWQALEAVVLTANMITCIVEVLSGGSKHSRQFAAGALRTLMISNHANMAAIAEAGAIPALEDLQRNGSIMAKEHATAVLAMLRTSQWVTLTTQQQSRKRARSPC